MTTKTHTKGEWIFNKYTPCDFGVYSTEGRGNDIALVRGSDEEAEANAKLIAAAPELLEACIESLSALKSGYIEQRAKATELILTAIKKATE